MIVISTEGKEEDTRKGLEAGAVAYIKKPFRSEEILEIISKTELVNRPSRLSLKRPTDRRWARDA